MTTDFADSVIDLLRIMAGIGALILIGVIFICAVPLILVGYLFEEDGL